MSNLTVMNASQPNFSYADAVNDAAGLPLALSIFADRAHIRDMIRDDAAAAGLRIVQLADVASLLEGDARPLGEVVVLDCPTVSGTQLAALMRLDMRAAHCQAQIIVSTTVDALDDVFACLDQSKPQILVDPSRAERVIALGRVLGTAVGARLRELSEEDRLVLLRLTEQVGQIAERLDRMNSVEGAFASAPLADSDESVFRFDSQVESPRRGFVGRSDDSGDRLISASRPALPDPRLIRRLIRHRQLRARFFEGDLFGDPAWDMLLDLTAARAEHVRVSITSLCIAAAVPPTTALRWIGLLTDAGLFQRVEDDSDRRRAFIALTDKAADAMARYFAELSTSVSRLV